MHPKMSQITRQEVLERKRLRYATAGKEHKAKIIDELIELFGYHRKAALRGTVVASRTAQCYGRVDSSGLATLKLSLCK